MRAEKKPSLMKALAWAYEWALGLSVLFLVIVVWMSSAS
jgi:hypothetical protein